MIKHGHCRNCCGKSKRSPTYLTWEKTLERCYNSNHRRFRYYGGRGVKVCKRWWTFSNFLKDMGVRPRGPDGVLKTLDRRDPDGHYCKRNCRWRTVTEQNNNQRRHHFVFGIELSDDPYPDVCGCGVDNLPCALHGDQTDELPF